MSLDFRLEGAGGAVENANDAVGLAGDEKVALVGDHELDAVYIRLLDTFMRFLKLHLRIVFKLKLVQLSRRSSNEKSARLFIGAYSGYRLGFFDLVFHVDVYQN